MNKQTIKHKYEPIINNIGQKRELWMDLAAESHTVYGQVYFLQQANREADNLHHYYQKYIDELLK